MSIEALTQHVSNPFVAGHWIVQERSSEEREVRDVVSNPFVAGHWIVLFLAAVVAYLVYVGFKPLRSGALDRTHWEAGLVGRNAPGFKPLRSGALDRTCVFRRGLWPLVR